MTSTKFKKRDANRFKKVYPYTPRRPALETVADKSFTLEEGSITLIDTDTGTYTFVEKYSSIPNVVISAYDSEGNNMPAIGINITSISLSSVTVSATASFTGKVNVQVLDIGD